MKAFVVLSVLAMSQATLIAPYANLGYAAAPYAGLPLGYAGAPLAAAPLAAPYAAAYAAPIAAPLPAPASQFNSADEFGNFNFGYANINSAKQEAGNAYGGVVGSYSYVDAYGIPQQVNYVADALGFRASATNLPVAPVAELKEPVFDLVGPAPVEDTPEVAAAKEEFFKAYSAAEEGSRKKRSLIASAPLAYAGAPLAYAGAYAGAYATPLAYNAAPLAYNAAPLAYNAAPLAYASPIAAPLAYAAPAAPAAEGILTRIKLNPGHAESYRVD